MISIIVYGRNDAYGYNLHKRAAISLNCLAQLLNDPDDELIFTDYNTPDDAPTFPEAIADTLTPHTRSVLRILRVRPRTHARFAQATTLPLIEAVARNVALRRSNAANRWILSTNTDIVLVPRQHRNLEEILRNLPGGFYHTARFEIPESVWEGFDRAAPVQIIDEVRGLGRLARLNEVVYGSPLILYDGPGDFQLAQRSDLFAIDGFDERMVQAWHVDSNLAKRLQLQRGAPVSSLLPHLYCYHCDHTRRAGPAHTLGTAQNDQARFVDQVAEAALPHQRDAWGCCHDDIEEVRIAEKISGSFAGLIRSLIEPLDTEITEAFYTADRFDDYSYDPRHVIPFIADLLQSYPRDTRLAWCGVRRDAFELVAKAWRKLGFRHRIVVHSAAAGCLCEDGDFDYEVADEPVWLQNADLFAFEFGRLSDAGSTETPANSGLSNDDRNANAASADADAIALVQTVFLSAVADERSRLKKTSAVKRRFLGINCIHNRTEGLFSIHVDAALTPFSSRLRHGFLASPPAAEDPETVLRLDIGRELGRAGAIAGDEFALADRLFGPLLRQEAIAADQQDQVALNAALGRAYLTVVGRHRKLERRVVDDALARLGQARASTALDDAFAFPIVPHPLRSVEQQSLSRFIQYEDWDDPVWSPYADLFLTERIRAPGRKREPARWEQAQLVYGLDRAGILTDASRILVIATMPDAVIGVISRRAKTVDVIALTREISADDPAPRSFWADGFPYRPRALEIYREIPEIQKSNEKYDAVVFPHGAMFGDGLLGAIGWMNIAESLLRLGGILAFKAEVAPLETRSCNCFDSYVVGDDGLIGQLKRFSKLLVKGGFDASLTQATVDRTKPEGAAAFTDEAFLIDRRDGGLFIPSLWFLEKQERAQSSWERIRAWVLNRLLGEQLLMLHIGPAGQRNPDGSISALAKMRGHVFFGPYVAIGDGRYRVSLSLRSERGVPRLRRRLGTLEIVVDGSVAATRTIASSDIGAAPLTLDFEIRDAGDRPRPPTLEIRVHSTGDMSVRYTSVMLEVKVEDQKPLISGTRFRWGKSRLNG